MARNLLLFLLLLLPAALLAQPAPPHPVPAEQKTTGSQWSGKMAGYLGDSMTDPKTSSTTAWYWQYLKALLNLDFRVYARSGYQWNDIYKMAEKMAAEKGDSLDVIFIWAGTNDYNHSVPIGQFFSESVRTTSFNGQTVQRKYRTPVMSDSTFCGRVNRVLAFLKARYPNKQIVVMTPIHRGFATFSSRNVQPDERYANGCGLYLEAYVEALKQAGQYWAVPVLDLHALSGLYPNDDAYIRYFNKADTDRLHPNANGHFRIARVMQYWLLGLPAEW